MTDRPHAPTPGEYMGHRRRRGRDTYSGREYRDDRYDDYRDSYRDRRDRDPYSRRYERDERDRDGYGRDNRDWRDRRSPPPARGGGRGYSPDYRRRRSYSRSPPRGSSPARAARDYDAPAGAANGGEPRW